MASSSQTSTVFICPVCHKIDTDNRLQLQRSESNSSSLSSATSTDSSLGSSTVSQQGSQHSVIGAPAGTGSNTSVSRVTGKRKSTADTSERPPDAKRKAVAASGGSSTTVAAVPAESSAGPSDVRSATTGTSSASGDARVTVGGATPEESQSVHHEELECDDEHGGDDNENYRGIDADGDEPEDTTNLPDDETEAAEPGNRFNLSVTMKRNTLTVLVIGWDVRDPGVVSKKSR